MMGDLQSTKKSRNSIVTIITCRQHTWCPIYKDKTFRRLLAEANLLLQRRMLIVSYANGESKQIRLQLKKRCWSTFKMIWCRKKHETCLWRFSQRRTIWDYNFWRMSCYQSHNTTWQLLNTSQIQIDLKRDY